MALWQYQMSARPIELQGAVSVSPIAWARLPEVPIFPPPPFYLYPGFFAELSGTEILRFTEDWES